MKQRIALIGLSGSGKTTVGTLVANKLGWRFVDTDREIEQQTGHATQQLFVEWGESAFRAKEREVLGQALHEPNTVVATDGGVVEDAANRDLLGSSAFNVWLHAPTAVLMERLRTHSDQAPPARFNHLQQRRAPFYTALADWMVATHVRTPHEVADDIVDGYRRSQQPHDDTLRVTTPGGSYPIYLAAGALAELPQRLQEVGVGGQLWLLSDEQVMPLHGERVVNTLENAGRSVHSFAIGAGEAHKTLQTVDHVYNWLLRSGVERGDVVLALGGGVVGDLAGFVAATVLRGIAFVQLPTNVLAMVDSAIGGKTGVDHAVGKNLIGAFWQPRLVLCDTTLLQTLPPADRVAGWAEAIKHGIIGDKELFAALQQHVQALLNGEEPITSDLLRRAAAFKARIVSGDEREQGDRILLNYGHTVGHAVEAESNYTLRHGEAVAIGMMAAGTLANAFGLFPDSALAEQRALLQAFGLPVCIPAGMNIPNVLQRITSDKKTRNAQVRWVLPTAIGSMTVTDKVPQNVVEVVLNELQS